MYNNNQRLILENTIFLSEAEKIDKNYVLEVDERMLMQFRNAMFNLYKYIAYDEEFNDKSTLRKMNKKAEESGCKNMSDYYNQVVDKIKNGETFFFDLALPTYSISSKDKINKVVNRIPSNLRKYIFVGKSHLLSLIYLAGIFTTGSYITVRTCKLKLKEKK